MRTFLRYRGRVVPRIRLILCKCERRYLNSPLSDVDNTAFGICELCQKEAERSFSEWLKDTGGDLMPEWEPSASDIQDAREAGFKVVETERVK